MASTSKGVFRSIQAYQGYHGDICDHVVQVPVGLFGKELPRLDLLEGRLVPSSLLETLVDLEENIHASDLTEVQKSERTK